MSVVGLYGRTPEPGTQFFQGREVVLDLPERRRPLAPRQILQQLGGPGVGLSRAVPDNAGQDVVMQEQVIDAGRMRDQAVAEQKSALCTNLLRKSRRHPDRLLAMGGVEATGDDHCGSDQGPAIRHIAEDHIAQQPGPDELAVGKWRQHGGTRLLESQHNEPLRDSRGSPRDKPEPYLTPSRHYPREWHKS